MDQKKKVIKNPIHFQLELNKEQSDAKEQILRNKITVLQGQAGSGKSMLAAQIALDLLFRKEVDRIVLTRPTTTAGEEIGFMPGNIDAKLAPYTAAIYDNMYRLYNRDKIDSLLHEGKIEVIPLAFMRGRNMTDCIVVVDEAQNVTDKQMELMLGRLCKGSKMILCGDITQCDLKDRKHSGFEFITDNLRDIEGFKVITLLQNHRDPIVEQILEVYANRK